MNICFKFHSNTSDVCQNIQFKSENVDHIMEEKSRDHQSQYNLSSREYERPYNIPCQYTEMSMRYWHYCVAKTTKLTYLAHKTPWTVSPRVCTVIGKGGWAISAWQKAGEKVVQRQHSKFRPLNKYMYIISGDNNSTGEQNSALQEKLPLDLLTWVLPISHLAGKPTGRNPLSLCSHKCNIWITWWWLSWAESLNSFYCRLENLPLSACMCEGACAPVCTGRYREKP